MMDVEETARVLFEEQADRYGYEALTWDSPALNRQTFIDRAERLLSSGPVTTKVPPDHPRGLCG